LLHPGLEETIEFLKEQLGPHGGIKPHGGELLKAQINSDRDRS
jgi:hypothetical protein